MSDFLPSNFSVDIEQVYLRFGKGKEVRTPFLLEYSYPGKMKYLNLNKYSNLWNSMLLSSVNGFKTK